MAIKETATGVAYDNLFGGPEVTALTANVKVASSTALKRGALLTLDSTSGNYGLAAKGKAATAVLADDTAAAADGTIATVYTRGYFNREALTVADGDTVDAHEEELRGVGIFLTSVK